LARQSRRKGGKNLFNEELIISSISKEEEESRIPFSCRCQKKRGREPSSLDVTYLEGEERLKKTNLTLGSAFLGRDKDLSGNDRKKKNDRPFIWEREEKRDEDGRNLPILERGPYLQSTEKAQRSFS